MVTLTDDKSRKAAMVHRERAKGLQKLNSWSFILSEKGLLLRLLQNSITLPYLFTFVLGTGDSFPRPNFTDDIQNIRYLPEYRFLTLIASLEHIDVHDHSIFQFFDPFPMSGIPISFGAALLRVLVTAIYFVGGGTMGGAMGVKVFGSSLWPLV